MARDAQKPSSGETDFGYRRVPLGDKQGLVDGVFDSVARRYDLMNDLMSGGLHRAWKEALVTAVNPPRGLQAGRTKAGRQAATANRPFTVLDLAGGTGDVAFRIAEKSPGSLVTVAMTKTPDNKDVTLGVIVEKSMANPPTSP